MSLHRTQARAVERALRAKRCGTVHVMGPKEGGTLLTAYERRCDEPNVGHRVVYHVAVIPTHDGRHACASCGEVSGGSAGKSRRPRLAS